MWNRYRRLIKVKMLRRDVASVFRNTDGCFHVLLFYRCLWHGHLRYEPGCVFAVHGDNVFVVVLVELKVLWCVLLLWQRCRCTPVREGYL